MKCTSVKDSELIPSLELFLLLHLQGNTLFKINDVGSVKYLFI